MRITRDLLLKLTREKAADLARRDRQITCIYLTGSLLEKEPLLGGSTDIDLMVVHSSQPETPRQFIPLTDAVHFDLQHVAQELYYQPRHLRGNAWIGSYLCQDALCLFDTQHWFEFTQAAVCAQFNRPEYVLQRARPAAETARRLWMELTVSGAAGSPEQVCAYFDALEQAAQAVALLSGPPLVERRFLSAFGRRARAIERPGLFGGLVDLFMPAPPDDAQWQALAGAWEGAFDAAAGLESPPAGAVACRREYLAAGQRALRPELPEAAVWLLARSLAPLAAALPPGHAALPGCLAALAGLELDAAHFRQRLAGLDSYLDSVEEALEDWARRNGVEEGGLLL